jgi:hypothetical protein
MGLWRKPLLATALAAALMTAAGPVARADVDPASDVLLLQDVFVPYHPKVCSGAANSLRDLAKRSKKAGYQVRVAIIGSRKDLGGAPQLFNKPKAYAIFLGSELGVFGGSNYVKKLALLVVMPAGVALARTATVAEQRHPPPLPPEISDNNFAPEVTPIAVVPPALKGVTVPPNADNNALARVAIAAIPRLAKGAGHPIRAGAAGSGKCSGGGISSTALIFGVPILLLIVGMVGVTGFQRMRARRAGE